VVEYRTCNRDAAGSTHTVTGTNLYTPTLTHEAAVLNKWYDVSGIMLNKYNTAALVSFTHFRGSIYHRSGFSLKKPDIHFRYIRGDV